VWGMSPTNTNRTRRPPGKYFTDPGVFFCPAWIHHLRSSWAPYNGWSWKFAPDDLHRAFMIEDAGDSGSIHYIRWGYNVFPGGCNTANKAPYDKYEVPYRIHANFRRLSISSNPKCWVTADYGAYDKNDLTMPLPHHIGTFVKHFTWPYNVVHMDGHADTHQIDPFRGGTASGGWNVFPGLTWVAGGSVPYGNTGYDDSPWGGFGKQVTGLDMEEDKKGK
jgi:hypothetical protein